MDTAQHPVSPIPAVVYRYFHQEDHARRFLDGHVWISTGSWCLAADRRRADQGASDSDAIRSQEFHDGNFSMSVSDSFMFCTSLNKPNDLLRSLFGNVCVSIAGIPEFTWLVAAAIHRQIPLAYGSAGLVVYDRPEKSTRGDETPRNPLSGPTVNAAENEFRIYWLPQSAEPIRRFQVYVPEIKELVRLVAK
jgi:hypothetical protein